MKICDFGYAHAFAEKGAMTKDLLGTPGYVAPEVLAQRPYGTEADMWSFGVILYILLCGFSPFDPDVGGEVAWMTSTLGGTFGFPEKDWGAVSPHAKDLVSKLLCVDQKTRYTGQQVLSHPWMKAPKRTLSGLLLVNSRKNLKGFMARRKWQKAGMGILALIKFHKNLKASSDRSVGD